MKTEKNDQLAGNPANNSNPDAIAPTKQGEGAPTDSTVSGATAEPSASPTNDSAPVVPPEPPKLQPEIQSVFPERKRRGRGQNKASDSEQKSASTTSPVPAAVSSDPLPTANGHDANKSEPVTAKDPKSDSGSDPKAPADDSASVASEKDADGDTNAGNSGATPAKADAHKEDGADDTLETVPPSNLKSEERDAIWKDLTSGIKPEPKKLTEAEKLAPWRDHFRRARDRGIGWEKLSEIAARPEIGAKVKPSTLRRLVGGRSKRRKGNSA